MFNQTQCLSVNTRIKQVFRVNDFGYGIREKVWDMPSDVIMKIVSDHLLAICGLEFLQIRNRITAMKIEAMVVYKCPNLKVEVTVNLWDLDIEEDARNGVQIEVFCKCGNYHTLLGETR